MLIVFQNDRQCRFVWRSSIRKNNYYRHHPYSHNRNSIQDGSDLDAFANRPDILRRGIGRNSFRIGREFHSEPERPSMDQVSLVNGIHRSSRPRSFPSSTLHPAASASSLVLPSRVAVASDSTSGNLYHLNIVQLSHIRYKQRQTVVRMLVVIVVTFALLNLPFHLRKLCINYLPSFDLASDTSNFIAPLTYLLMYGNCALNPILYAFFSKQFRSSLRDLLRCRRRRSTNTRVAALP